MDEANSRNSSLAIEFVSFVKTMHATGDWEPYPILLMASRPLGPIQKAFSMNTAPRHLML